MGTADKASNKIEDLKGRVKQATGRATGNKDLESQGRADQVEAAVKDVGQAAKDAAKDVREKVKEAGATVDRIVKR